MAKKEKLMEVEFLSFNCSNGVPRRYTGSLLMNNSLYKFSLTEQLDSCEEYYRGRVTAQSKTGKAITITVKNKNGEIKSKYVTYEKYVYSHDEKEIKRKIAEMANKLYAKHAIEIENDLFESLRQDTITPLLAVNKHGFTAIDYSHKAASETSKMQYYNRLKRAAEKLPNKPMCQITERTIKSWEKTTSFSRNEMQELKKFWEYCLLKRICIGDNPIHITRKKKRNKKDKNNTVTIDKLLPEQSQDLYDYINDNTTGPHMGTILALGGGFNPKKIIELKWSDIMIISDNYVIVRDYMPQRAGATKNYTRPLMPQAARIISKRYNELLKEYSSKQMNNMPVVSSKGNPVKQYNIDALKKDASRLITRYVSHEMLKQISNEDLDYAAPFKILKNTYKYDLEVRCSLNGDPSVCNFLLGKSLSNDVTSDSYRTFTSHAGLRHLHELTLFLDKEIPTLEPGISTIHKGESTINIIRPDNNHCSIDGFVEFELPPKCSCISQTRYGVDGYMEVEPIT